MKILLIEDDKELASTISDELWQDYVVEIALTGQQGEFQSNINQYDLLIVDWMLPDLSGLDLVKNLRKNQIKSPILMLTAKGQLSDKIQALDTGADDYLTKPFDTQELKARIRALLRRSPENLVSNIVTIGDLTIDFGSKVVKRANNIITLRRKEFYLLEYLARNVGRVISREMILEHVWNSEDEPITNTIDVHIKYLRDRIDKKFDRKLIKTVYGLGYKLEA